MKIEPFKNIVNIGVFENISIPVGTTKQNEKETENVILVSVYSHSHRFSI